jgi:murein DD-endopeptidase MepM/ murein hydrolase activator NlpD
MWPFKRKPKQANALPKYDRYVRAKKAGTVTAVQQGMVAVEDIIYDRLRKTHVVPGQRVKAGQPIGTKE